MKIPRRLLSLCTCIAFGINGYATDISFSGFADMTAGKILSGNLRGQSQWLSPNYNCPCFISNYEYGGVYQNNGWNASNESMVGVQANAHIDDQLSAVVQVDARGLNGYQASVDWAYVSYNLNNQFTVQAGRKRLPLYMYSDYNYIGYAYPWIRPPVDLYGWEIYSYDGANLQYTNTFGDWALSTNSWAGNSTNLNAPGLTNIYNTGTPMDTSWRDIIGTSIDFSNDYVHLRAVYMQNSYIQSKQQLEFPAATNSVSPGIFQYAANAPYAGGRQQVWGLAFNADYDNFIWKSEYNDVRRPTSPYVANASGNGGSFAPGYSGLSFLTAAGYKYQQVTLLYTFSQYWEHTSDYQYYSPQRDNTRSVVVRWDFHTNAALKMEYDVVKDHSATLTSNGAVAPGGYPVFVGNSKLLAVGLDVIF